MPIKTYYDNDSDINDIKNETVGIIGFGIQGRAQALNLRDSGINVIIGNKKDDYYDKAVKDGFEVYSIDEILSKSSIIMMLIPDQAHKPVFEKHIRDNISENDMLVFAHGYSLRFGEIELPKYVDAILLAPRMPGGPIREYYLDGGGSPAFFDVYQEYSGNANKRGLALAKALGFTRSGVMQVSVAEETEIDLFMEQFLIPSIIQTMKIAFDLLVDKGFSPEAVLMELYASGELGEVLLKASKLGMFRVFKKNASPTCQFGIQHTIDKILPGNVKDNAVKIFQEIQDGTFAKLLTVEGSREYPKLNEYYEKSFQSLMEKTQRELDRIITYRPNQR